MVYDNSFTQEQREQYDLMKAFGLPLTIKEYFSLEDRSLDGIRAFLKKKNTPRIKIEGVGVVSMPVIKWPENNSIDTMKLLQDISSIEGLSDKIDLK